MQTAKTTRTLIFLMNSIWGQCFFLKWLTNFHCMAGEEAREGVLEPCRCSDSWNRHLPHFIELFISFCRVAYLGYMTWKEEGRSYFEVDICPKNSSNTACLDIAFELTKYPMFLYGCVIRGNERWCSMLAGIALYTNHILILLWTGMKSYSIARRFPDIQDFEILIFYPKYTSIFLFFISGFLRHVGSVKPQGHG